MLLQGNRVMQRGFCLHPISTFLGAILMHFGTFGAYFRILNVFNLLLNTKNTRRPRCRKETTRRSVVFAYTQ